MDGKNSKHLSNELITLVCIFMGTLALGIDIVYGIVIIAMSKAGAAAGPAVVAVITVIAVVCLAGDLLLLKKKFDAKLSPLKGIRNAVQVLDSGELSKVEVPAAENNEIGEIAEALRSATEKFQTYIGEITRVCNQLAGKDFLLQRVITYDGDWLSIEKGFAAIANSLSAAIHTVEDNANQVASGAGELSNGANTLAQGSTEQASSIEEIAATLTEISRNVSESAENAEASAGRGQKLQENSIKSKEKMAQLVNAIEEIRQKSTEIDKITKTIEDIAFQTNILALNASVEAARAGEAGRGFSVVADEVRNLAMKSAEAASSTTVLIDATVKSISEGTIIAEETSEDFNAIIEGVGKAVEMLRGIADTSVSQAQSVQDVLTAVEQVSIVTQGNAATAEESSALSEQLTDKSANLNELVSTFRLRDVAV